MSDAFPDPDAVTLHDGGRGHVPTDEDERRQVTVSLHDDLRPGTFRDIAETAGANDVEACRAWVDRNA